MISVGMGVPSLVIIRVLSRLTSVAGLVWVGYLVEGLVAFFDATCAHQLVGMAGGGGCGTGSPGGSLPVPGGAGGAERRGGGVDGLVDWMMCSRDSLSSSATVKDRSTSGRGKRATM